MTNIDLITRIVRVARNFIGETEKPGNTGFKNILFEAKMKLTGWLYKQSWCAYAAELVWFDAFEGDKQTQALIRKYCSGSAVQTYRNFEKSKEFHVQPNPTVGAICIFKHGNGPLGHAGVVTELKGANGFLLVEGNGSAAGSREGTMMVEKLRMLNRIFSVNGLNIMGFINPIRIA